MHLSIGIIQDTFMIKYKNGYTREAWLFSQVLCLYARSDIQNDWKVTGKIYYFLRILINWIKYYDWTWFSSKGSLFMTIRLVWTIWTFFFFWNIEKSKDAGRWVALYDLLTSGGSGHILDPQSTGGANSFRIVYII